MKLAFLIIAIVLFILAGLGVAITPNLLAWGMVAFASSFLPLQS